MIIRVLDVETCSLTANVVEIATVDLVRVGDEPWHRGRMWSSLVNPGGSIPPEASAVHHIVDADVASAPTFADVLPKVFEAVDDSGPPMLFAAHNIRFESQFITLPEGARWICTYKLGVTLWPDCPSHKNQVLRYFLHLNLEPALAMPPHRAGPDAYVTAAILRTAFRDFVVTPEDMVDISSKPVLLPRLHFGQHAGKPIADVPDSYLVWMTKQDSMDPDALYTAQCHLHDRRLAARSRGPVSADKVHEQQTRAESRR